MVIHSKSPGKMIILGEYAVLEGAPALVCAVDRYAYVTVEQNGKPVFEVEAPNLDIGPTAFEIVRSGVIRFVDADMKTKRLMNFFRLIFEFAWGYFQSRKIRIPPLRISIDTGVFYSSEIRSKLGFGSSAAMTVALIRALFEISGCMPADPECTAKIFRLALGAHRKAQGNLGSGIDIAASTFGGILVYKMELNDRAEQNIPEKLEPWDDLHMIPVWTGRSESTRTMVRGVNVLKTTHPELYASLLTELSDLSVSGVRAFRERNLEAFLETINAYVDCLRRLGDESRIPIVSDAHLDLMKAIRNAGGMYKPSGAGSGDIGIAFVPHKRLTGALIEAVHARGYHTVACNIASVG